MKIADDDTFLGRAIKGEVICDIGQLNYNPIQKRALIRAVRSGIVVKWRGYWFPNAGAPFGIGPLKTCYGLPAVRDAMAAISEMKEEV
jgi:hypothetical protein